MANVLAAVQVKVYVIDLDSDRWGCFLEASGVEVSSPENARLPLPKDAALLLVSIQNHIKQGQLVIGDKHELLLPGSTWVNEK